MQVSQPFGYDASMEETKTYQETLPKNVLSRYRLFETAAASKMAASLCFDEWEDVVAVIDEFSLTSRLLLTKGGNQGPVPRVLNAAFKARGWQEARVDVETRTYLFPGSSTSKSAEDDPSQYEEYLHSRSYQLGYAIDNFKGRIALDVEWNPKDGNLDRDFAAYRAWHDRGVISLAVLITRVQDSTKMLAKRVWDEYTATRPSLAGCEQPVTYSTTTTANFEKAIQRVKRGDLGTCPILIIGIDENTWDGVPWDGMGWKWNKDAQKLELAPVFISNAKEAIGHGVGRL